MFAIGSPNALSLLSPFHYTAHIFDNFSSVVPLAVFTASSSFHGSSSSVRLCKRGAGHTVSSARKPCTSSNVMNHEEEEKSLSYVYIEDDSPSISVFSFSHIDSDVFYLGMHKVHRSLILATLCPNDYECRPISKGHTHDSVVVFDKALFYHGWYQYFEDTVSTDTLLHSHIPYLCSSLHSAFQSPATLSILTDMSREEGSFDWLTKVCGAKNTINVVKLSKTHRKESSDPRSRCSVISLTGFGEQQITRTRRSGHIDKSDNNDGIVSGFDYDMDVPYCLEDVVVLLMGVKGQQQRQRDGAAAGSDKSSVFVVSSQGLDQMFPPSAFNFTSASMEISAWLTLDELGAVFKAFGNVRGVRQIHIRSIFSELFRTLSDESTVRTYEMLRYTVFDLMSRLFDECDEESYTALLAQLEEAINSEAVVNDTQLLVLITALKDYSSYEHVNPYISYCDDEKSDRSMLYICQVQEARLALINLLGIAAARAKSIKVITDFFDNYIPFLRGDVEQKPKAIQSLPPPKIMAGEADIHILCYVKEKDRVMADQIIDHWHKLCDLCSYFVRYVRITVSEEPLFTSSRISSSSNDPSTILREALSKTQTYTERMSLRKDVLVVLVGIEAMKSFKAPRTDQPDVKSVIPICNYGENGPYLLPSNITFAFDHLGQPYLYSFLGSTHDIRGMLRYVDSRSALMSGEQIRQLLENYVEMHSHFASYDVDNLVFHMNPTIVEIHAEEYLRSLRTTTQEYWTQKIVSESLNHYHLGVNHNYVDEKAALIPNLHRNFLTYRSEAGAIDTDQLQEIIDDLHEKLRHGVWTDLVNNLIQLLRDLLPTSYMWMPIFITFQIGRYVHQFANEMELPNFKKLIEQFTSYVKSMNTNKNHGRIDIVAVHAAISSILKEMGDLEGSTEWLATSVVHVLYTDLDKQRAEWKQKRKLYLTHFKSPNARYKVHYLTMASEDKVELRNLKTTAILSGIELVVLGLGEGYQFYDDKLKRYYSYIQNSQVVKDDDLVVLLDAYDVLLFPSIRRMHHRMATSRTPVLACAESGIYPEPYTPWVYPQGLPGDNSSFASLNAVGHAFLEDKGQSRFLNSGCIAGRGADVRKMLDEVFQLIHFIKDDQQVFVRYMLSHPHILSIDMPSFFLKEKMNSLSKDSKEQMKKIDALSGMTLLSEEEINRAISADSDFGSLYRDLRHFNTYNEANKSVEIVMEGGIFMTGFKGIPLDTKHYIRYDFSIVVGLREGIGLLHCNNRLSNNLYDRMAHQVQDVLYRYYKGEDGNSLLKAVHDMIDGDVTSAFLKLTSSESIVRNASYTLHCEYEDVLKCLHDPQKGSFRKSHGKNILSALLLRDIFFGPNLARTSNVEHEESFANEHLYRNVRLNHGHIKSNYNEL